MNIKTWKETALDFPLEQRGMVTNQMIWMQQEIDALRAALEQETKLSHKERRVDPR